MSLRQPFFSYGKGKAPEVLNRLNTAVAESDAFVAVTPEYNHMPGPALMQFFNLFGSSVFSFKPSAIVSYSAGKWGGTRAAHSLRPLLSELGMCLLIANLYAALL
jgi:chromate reductase